MMKNADVLVKMYEQDERYLSIQEKVNREKAIRESYYDTQPNMDKGLRIIKSSQLIEMEDLVEKARPKRAKVNEEITWEMLLKYEPRLTLLDDMTDSFLEIQAKGDDGYDFYYGYNGMMGFGMKELASELVGWGSENTVSELHSMEAFDVVTDRVLTKLGMR